MAKDQRASALIGLDLSDAYLHHIDLSRTSKEIWDGLNILFGSQASSAKMSIKQKLFRLKMNEGNNIVQHISTFRSLLNQLAGVNSKVDDDDAKAILLSSMPSSFDHIVFTLNKTNPNLETIISSLIDEGSRAHKSHNFTEDCVLFAKKKSSAPGRRELKCFYCQQSGHVQMNCFQRAKDHRASALIGLGLSDAYLHHIDLSKTLKEIWDRRLEAMVVGGFLSTLLPSSIKEEITISRLGFILFKTI